MCCCHPRAHVFFFLGGGGGRVGGGLLVMVWKQGRRGGSQPDQRRQLQPETPSSPPPTQKNNKNKNLPPPRPHPAPTPPPPPMASLYLTRDDSINLRTCTLTHNRTLRPVSLSRRSVFPFLFFVFFHSSGIFFFFFLVGKEEELFSPLSFKWERGGGWSIVMGWGREGCLVRGIPRCCSPSAPGKEREKEGEFFFSDWLQMDTDVLVWCPGVCVCVCVKGSGKGEECHINVKVWHGKDSPYKRDIPS